MKLLVPDGGLDDDDVHVFGRGKESSESYLDTAG